MSSSICMRDHWVLCQAGTWLGWRYWSALTFTQGHIHSLLLTTLLKISWGIPTTCLPDLRKPMAVCLLEKKCGIHRTKGAWIVSPNYWETSRGCAFIANDSTQREWIKGMKQLAMALQVYAAGGSSSSLWIRLCPVPWRRSCRLYAVWSCPWCWSPAPRVPLRLKVSQAIPEQSFQAGAFGINLLWLHQKLHQCAGNWGNSFKKSKGLNAKTGTGELKSIYAVI